VLFYSFLFLFQPFSALLPVFPQVQTEDCY